MVLTVTNTFLVSPSSNPMARNVVTLILVPMGGILHNLGQATTEVRLSSATGRARNVTWQNVKIEFPILGTKALAADPDHRSEIRYRDDGGAVVELQDHHSSPSISHDDVYFMKVYMNTKNLRKPEGFARPGAAPWDVNPPAACL